jgi:xanthine dehydrogenase YagR molybdenum-binding subunit
LADGTLILQSGVTDMGPGTATAMTKLASETFGIPESKIKFEMGDSDLRPDRVNLVHKQHLPWDLP